MKKIIKALFLTATATGMLFTSIPVSVLAQEPTSPLPDKLLSAQELPKGAVVKGEERIDNTIYAYDDKGNLVSTERVYNGSEDYAVPEREETRSVSVTMVPAKEETHITSVSVVPAKEEINAAPEETLNEGPLTPDGNMTLVDDYGDKPVAGKQFITLTTRSGAEFYLIIDRDDNGIETVHFLNKVDESDILSYLEDDEKAAYEERKTALEEDKAALRAEEKKIDGNLRSLGNEDSKTDKTGETASSEEEDPKAKESSLIIVIIFLVAGIAAVIYIFVIKKKKRGSVNPAPTAPDPDDFDDDLDDEPDEGEDESDEDV